MSQISSASIAGAVETLRRGEVIVFPTETLYGLGADALNREAVQRVYQLKGRQPQIPIPVLVADEAMLDQLVGEVPAVARKLMERFWPGPLTLVLPARAGVPEPLLNAAGGIGVRISSQPIANELLRALGHPLTATSANPSGKEPARSLEEAKDYFRGQVQHFIDGGTLTSRTGSTVLEVTGKDCNMLREGDISVKALKDILSTEIRRR